MKGIRNQTNARKDFLEYASVTKSDFYSNITNACASGQILVVKLKVSWELNEPLDSIEGFSEPQMWLSGEAACSKHKGTDSRKTKMKFTI